MGGSRSNKGKRSKENKSFSWCGLAQLRVLGSLGDETSPGSHRCLIIQNDIGNEESELTTVVPFLSRKNYPFVVNVQPSELNQLDKERGLHFNQIRSVDSSRLKSKLGTLELEYFSQIKRALDIQFGFF